jgi:hypothetical protein
MLEEMQQLYDAYIVMKCNKFGRLKWAGHVMRTEESDSAKKVLCIEPEENG